MSLEDLARKYSTDKLGHNYIKKYEDYFNNTKQDILKILEIGIFKGDSIKMWKEYFPNATIYGIDINQIELPNIKIFIGNQSDRKFLHEFIDKSGNDFDIIIDDGSHTMPDQQISFGYLFPYIKKGGYYIIEDISTSFDWQYERYEIIPNRSNTTYNVLDYFNKYNKFKSYYITKKEKHYLEKNVDKCDIYETRNDYQSIIAFIKKK